MAGRHKKRRELSSAQTRVLRGSVVAAPLCAGLLAGATNASAEVNTLPSGPGTHAPVLKGTGPGTGRAPVITWDFMNGVDPASQNIILKGVQNWDESLRKQTGTTTPWFVKGSQSGPPALLFNIARLNRGLAGLAGDNCTFTRVQCGHGQRVTLNSDWWHGRANDEQKLGVVSHEMGHALGLGHATGGREPVPGNPDEVMRPTIAFRGAPGTPSTNETAAVAKIYGQSSKGPTTPVTPPTQQPPTKQTGPDVQQPPTKQTGPDVQQPQPRTQEDGWKGEWRRNGQGQWEGHWARDGWQGDWKLVDGKWQGQWTPVEKDRQTQPQQQDQRGAQPHVQQANAWAEQSQLLQSPAQPQGQSPYQQAAPSAHGPGTGNAVDAATGGSTGTTMNGSALDSGSGAWGRQGTDAHGVWEADAGQPQQMAQQAQPQQGGWQASPGGNYPGGYAGGGY